MPPFTCCFGNWKGNTPNSSGAPSLEQPSTSGPAVQNEEQPSTSDPAVQNAEQPSTSDPAVQNEEQPTTSDAGVQNVDQPSTSSRPVRGGNLTYDEVGQVLFRLAGFKNASQYSEEGEICYGTLNNQNVAIKGFQNQGSETEEFDAIFSPLKEANHPNLIKVMGHIFRWESRFVIYKWSDLDSLELHLFDPDKEPLDCNTRMKIAIGSAEGMEYLHSMNPPVVHRNLKTENVLLEEGFAPKLFDFGMPKKAHEWWNRSRPFGIVGWIAPEYIETGQLTLETDVYSFGVLLLVILTGRKAFDEKKLHDRSVAAWARSVWDKEIKDKDLKDIEDEVFNGILDPRMKGNWPKEIAYPYLKLALKCIDLNPSSRPKMPIVRRQLVMIASLHTAETEIPNEPSSA